MQLATRARPAGHPQVPTQPPTIATTHSRTKTSGHPVRQARRPRDHGFRAAQAAPPVTAADQQQQQQLDVGNLQAAQQATRIPRALSLTDLLCSQRNPSERGGPRRRKHSLTRCVFFSSLVGVHTSKELQGCCVGQLLLLRG